MTDPTTDQPVAADASDDELEAERASLAPNASPSSTGSGPKGSTRTRIASIGIAPSPSCATRSVTSRRGRRPTSMSGWPGA